MCPCIDDVDDMQEGRDRVAFQPGPASPFIGLVEMANIVKHPSPPKALDDRFQVHVREDGMKVGGAPAQILKVKSGLFAPRPQFHLGVVDLTPILRVEIVEALIERAREDQL
jgi:hypothetical protein